MEKLIEEYGNAAKSLIVSGSILGIVCGMFFFTGIPQLLISYVTEVYG